MRPGFINSFRPSRQYVDPFSLGTRTPLESFEYAGNWSETIADPVDYPSTFTGFSTPSNETPLESFEYAENWSGTIAAPVDYPPTFTGFSTPSNETPLESFERSAAATPPGDPPSDWPA